MEIVKDGQVEKLQLSWEELEILYHYIRYIRKNKSLPAKYYNFFRRVEVS